MATSPFLFRERICAYLVFLSIILVSQTSATAHSTRKHVLRELHDYEAVANPRAVIVNGNVRITVLTNELLRIEQKKSSALNFEDRATLAFVNRYFSNDDVPDFSHYVDGKILHLKTSSLYLQLQLNCSLSQDTLKISSLSRHFTKDYAFGDSDRDNLLGTIRTLDMLGPVNLNCSTSTGTRKIEGELLHCTQGLVSRTGWTVVNDVTSPRLDKDTGWWSSASTALDHDIYFFGHQSHKQALEDYNIVGGRVPMIPRYLLGIWWTRWFDYDGDDLINVIKEFKSHNLPLDNLVLDMNWHQKNSWGGYTWDKNLFPNPKYFLKKIKTMGISSVWANLHDADGIHAYEERYAEVSKALNINASGESINFQVCSSRDYAFAIEDLVLDKLGFDHWWIDYQQGGENGDCTGGSQNPTIWLNRIRATRSFRLSENKRDAVLGRWGGLGSHRYPVGFSGDVDRMTWSRLAYQPYFTITSANVAYGLWSHDIGAYASTPELHVRWVQWAAFSPIFRYHDRGQSAGLCAVMGTSCDIVEPWKLPYRYFKPVREAMHIRAKLLPYIYSSYFEMYNTGLSFVRPLYYDFQGEDMAYVVSQSPDGKYAQYSFGNDMMVAPIVHKADAGQLVRKKLWIPPGNWYDLVYGTWRKGPKLMELHYDLDDIPIFIKKGSIIPQISLDSNTIGNAAKEYSNILLNVFSNGNDVSSAKVYQDDGHTLEYTKYSPKKRPRFIVAEFSANNGLILLSVDLGQSSMLKHMRVKFHDINPPANVKLVVDGTDFNIPFSPFGASTQIAASWTYSSKELGVVVYIPLEIFKPRHIEISFMTIHPYTVAHQGMKGRIKRARQAKALLDYVRQTPASNTPGPAMLIKMASTTPVCLETFADPLQANGANLFQECIANFSTYRKGAIEEIKHFSCITVGKERLSMVRELLSI